MDWNNFRTGEKPAQVVGMGMGERAAKTPIGVPIFQRFGPRETVFSA